MADATCHVDRCKYSSSPRWVFHCHCIVTHCCYIGRYVFGHCWEIFTFLEDNNQTAIRKPTRLTINWIGRPLTWLPATYLKWPAGAIKSASRFGSNEDISEKMTISCIRIRYAVVIVGVTYNLTDILIVTSLGATITIVPDDDGDHRRGRLQSKRQCAPSHLVSRYCVA